MKNLIVTAFIIMLVFGCKEKNEKNNKEMPEEEMTEEGLKKKKEGDWIVLFDGTSFDGWKGYLKDSVPDAWKLEDGAMVFYPPENRGEGESYNLVTDREFSNFILSLEWKISEGGNSGIFWGIKEDEKFNQPYETGPEIQVLDNEKHPDAKNGTSHQAGALYDMVAPSRDITKPIGEWNTCVITINYDEQQGSVMLNGEEIVTFPVSGELWDVVVSKSKFADWEGFGKFPTGKIGLQDHGDKVSFRNIKIKEVF